MSVQKAKPQNHAERVKAVAVTADDSIHHPRSHHSESSKEQESEQNDDNDAKNLSCVLHFASSDLQTLNLQKTLKICENSHPHRTAQLVDAISRQPETYIDLRINIVQKDTTLSESRTSSYRSWSVDNG
jgi:hypothetical protein